MKRTMYEAARHTPKRGAGSSNLPEDATFDAEGPNGLSAFLFVRLTGRKLLLSQCL